MWKTKHHVFATKVFKPLMRPVLFHKNHFKSKVYKLDKNKTYFILANHQTTWDPLLLYCSFKNVVYPVMAKDFIPMKYRKFVTKYVGPILKAKTLKDLGAIKNMIQVAKEGNIIYLYPEGNRTFSGELCYINDSTMKLIKKTKANVVYYNFIGGYGIDPRWGTTIRKGQFHGEINCILTSEEIANMTNEEFLAFTKEKLTVKEAPRENAIESQHRAEALERCLYRCPCCSTIGNLHSKGNKISCTCGLEVEYTPNLTFIPNKKEFKHHTVADWFKEQEEYIKNYQIEDNKIIFEEDGAILHEIHYDHDELITTGKLTLDDTSITIGDKKFNFSEILEMTVSGKQTLLFYVGTSTYRISSDIVGFNFIKYMQMYYHIGVVKFGINPDFLGI